MLLGPLGAMAPLKCWDGAKQEGKLLFLAMEPHVSAQEESLGRKCCSTMAEQEG